MDRYAVPISSHGREAMRNLNSRTSSTLGALVLVAALVAALPVAEMRSHAQQNEPANRLRQGRVAARPDEPVLVRRSAAADRPGDQEAGPHQGQIDPALFAGLKWRSVGPERGGRSTAVAGSAARPMEYYFGATGGGIWKTTDGGTTWRPVTDKFLESSSPGAVAVAPSNPDIVYAGMGETQLRGNIIQGDGVYKSADAGKTWEHMGLQATQAIARIRIHPTNPDIVWVAALGAPYGQTEERGVFKTTDAGKTWKRTLFRDTKSGAVDLALDPNNPNVLYATLWEVFRTPHSLSSGGPGSGLFKSTDAGDTWQEITRNQGLPKGMIGKSGISVSGADGNRVWAIVEAEDGGVFRSDDGGKTWTKTNEERKLRQRAFYYTRIYADPNDKEMVYVLNTGFYRSKDGGKTFPQSIRVPHGDNHDLWIAPNDPNRMINSNDGGANVSVNAGETWTEQDYPTAQLYNIVTTTHVPYHVCGAQQDNSTVCVSSAAGGGFGEGRVSATMYAVGGGESGYIAPDPMDPNVFYAGSYGGYLSRLDRSTGQQRSVNIWPDNPMGYSAKDIKERFQWTFPIVFSPIDRKTVYATSQHVWKTTNGGQSWEKIGPDLSRADVTTMGPSGGPITLDQTGVETYAVVFTLAPSRQDIDTLWAGSDDGVAHVTRDGGKTWEKITPPDLPEFARISLIEASPHQNGVAYLVANRYQRHDRGPYVYKTSDFGKTWTKIITGLPADDFPRAIREDHKRRGLLFLGTETGIYVSFNDGATWQSLRLDLPVTPVHGIVVEENDLVIGTHGRSAYILDDIGVLRQAGVQVTDDNLFVFVPRTYLRGRDRQVVIDYWLKNDQGKVTIEIVDAQGTVVRRFEGSNAAVKQTERPQSEEEDFFGGPRVTVGTKKGLNRVNWDMRYEGAIDFPGMIMWAARPQRGPAAPPGKYQVRVTADTYNSAKDFTIARHPRLTEVTDDDLQEQFKLSVQIRDAVTKANQHVITVRSVRTQVDDRLAKTTDKESLRRLQPLAEALLTKLSTAEAEIYQVKNQSSQDPLNYPIKLNNKIAALQGVVESADARPTDQSYAVFKELTAVLDKYIAQIEQALTTDLPKVNTELRRQKAEPVDPKKPLETPKRTETNPQ
jgi:photosystem II stability/assembly factor-like uncharacterized protein